MDWCDTCCQFILPQDQIQSLGRYYHRNCFYCAQCRRQLQAGKHLQLNQQLFCNRCSSSILLQQYHTSNDQDEQEIDDDNNRGVVHCNNIINSNHSHNWQDTSEREKNNAYQKPSLTQQNHSQIDSIKQRVEEYNIYYAQSHHLHLTIQKQNDNMIVHGLLKFYWHIQFPTRILDQHTTHLITDLIDVNTSIDNNNLDYPSFLPPIHSLQHIHISSNLSTVNVIALLLGKNKIIHHHQHYGLFLTYHHGYTRQLKEDEYPLLVRLQVGPSDEVCKIVLKEMAHDDQHNKSISQEAAQFMCFSSTELEIILKQYQIEEQRESEKIRTKYSKEKTLIENQLQSMQCSL
ncbi:Ras association domain-containing protein 6 [Trichoplax sp. H2]|nr:Ras association domain-containing protein 6 [Trichoplax sp. H2]|eukprot:RDD44510.1 Ras association domain-containing protein 6 [Trichoplax sp. H2]